MIEVNPKPWSLSLFDSSNAKGASKSSMDIINFILDYFCYRYSGEGSHVVKIKKVALKINSIHMSDHQHHQSYFVIIF